MPSFVLLNQNTTLNLTLLYVLVLMPGCKGNQVPLGFQSQPAATHTPVELLATRALPAKNKLKLN